MATSIHSSIPRSRRHFLRASGITLGLPLLESFGFRSLIHAVVQSGVFQLR